MNKIALSWITSDDTGISSKTIWSVMMGLVTQETQCRMTNNFDVPHDPADIGRCFRLLAQIPKWRFQIDKMNILPAWRPFVREWERMEKLFHYNQPCPELFALMQELEDEGRILDGWKKDSSSCWSRDKQFSITIQGKK